MNQDTPKSKIGLQEVFDDLENALDHETSQYKNGLD